MILNIFTVFDDKAAAYMQPFYARSVGEAVRMFQTTCNDKDSQFNRYPSDYTLFHIGQFDDQTAQLLPMKAHTALGKALEFLSKE